ncbi:putative E3 ubiquitin-protein ligase UNKL isoform X2 [Tigriopus californicus]|uniref:putative E3 ubiquitin-protein ligase UNKL isoform X2 n=1 Tax=Tigriopus californicus TaxID=6832 RepID=UPI0027DA9217|nr:putative E3 ubiquitin-protein ligase UNKL isoform X2 [Tigriopus californicus]
MPQHRSTYNKNGINSISSGLNKEELLDKYLKEFRVEQCPLFLQHKCQQHRPFTCFHWHFQNQRRRRPIRRRDGTFNYSADVYCSKYDETTGLCPDGDECPYLHRTAGDTERRYHLKYYKTGMCVHDTDNRGYCVKNGPHCAFAHGNNDLRPPVYDIRELQAIENGEVDPVIGLNSLDKERSMVNDDPKWLDTTFVLANYKTEPCKKPPRLCRQGYACPQYHNNKDKRRSPKKYKYRSTPCPQVKSGDEWGDPVGCDSGDGCQYCHTRTEQQFHPEIYKSTKCNDIQNTSYCPRGAFCAFAHIEQETVSLESPSPENGHNLGDILSHALPNSEDTSKNGSVNHGGRMDLHDMNSELNGTFVARGAMMRNGSITPPFEENGIASPIESNKHHLGQSGTAAQMENGANSSINNLSSSMDSAMGPPPPLPNSTNNGFVNNGNPGANLSHNKNRFLSGDLTSREALIRRQMFSIENNPNLSQMEKVQRKTSLMLEVTSSNGTNPTTSSNTTFANGSLFSSFNNAESLDSIGAAFEDLSVDPFEGSKSRKSSGFSETCTTKSRQCSGYDLSSGPNGGGNKSRNCSGNSITQGISGILNGSNPVMIPGSGGKISPSGNSPLMHTNGIGLENGHENNTTSLGMNQLGLFDLTSANNNCHGSPKSNSSIDHQKDLEIARLREELQETRNRLASWDEGILQARNACEAWKKESAIATKKAELAQRDRESALQKAVQFQKEVETLNGGPYLHAIKRVDELKALPPGVLKALEWQLRKDLQEVEKTLRMNEANNQWVSGSNNSTHNRLFDFSTPTSDMWGSGGGLGLISHQHHHMFGSLAQQ